MSTIKTTTLSNVAGTSTVPVDTVINGSAKAWVNFNGTGTVAIRASFNVSSITDNGTGDYTVNFTTALADANYCIQTPNVHEPGVAVWDIPIRLGTRTTTSCRVQCMNTASTAVGDTSEIDVAIFR